MAYLDIFILIFVKIMGMTAVGVALVVAIQELGIWGLERWITFKGMRRVLNIYLHHRLVINKLIIERGYATADQLFYLDKDKQ